MGKNQFRRRHLMSDMATYPTPPSSSGDSPQPIYFVSSPGSNSFSSPPHFQPQVPEGIDMVELESLNIANKPMLKFIEQPINKFRFRYKSEMAGTHGSLCGMNSDKSRKQTYPAVELINCSVKAAIRCSIYQYNVKDDYKPHPHRLIMKRGREEHDDPHDIIVGPEEGFVATFHSMGIIHTARKNIVGELIRKKTQLKTEQIAREEMRSRQLTMAESMEIKRLAEDESKSINLNIVCLRFDAFYVKDGILRPLCDPIYSHGINNLKCALTGDLKIVRMDHCTSPAKGGKEIFLLVERVTKKNIKIRFYELDDEEQEVWEGWGKFSELDVHHQYAIVFKTPPYTRNSNITQPVRVYMELVRPSDNARSECKEFRYVPNNEFKPGSKRPRSSMYSSSSYNSSSMSSSEIPATVNNFSAAGNPATIQNYELGGSWNGQILTNEQIATAITDINSDEFISLFNTIEDEYPEFPEGVMAKDCMMTAQQRNLLNRNLRMVGRPSCIPSEKVIKMEVNEKDLSFANRTYNELKSFLKSEDARLRAPEMIHKYLAEEKKTNALHVFVCLNQMEPLKFLLFLLHGFNQTHLINVLNADMYSPLHLAVLCKNDEFVKLLLKFKANPCQMDRYGNSALHLAIENMVGPAILESLIHEPNSKNVIDSENYDGDAPIHKAIEKKNMTALKVLCKNNADINKKHKKNGYTPLRIALENQFADMVAFILEHRNFDLHLQNDFGNISPFQVAASKELSDDIKKIIQNYLDDKGILIKQEKEDEDEESDEEMDEDIEIKTEPVSVDNAERLYESITGLTDKCLDEVSSILEASGKWNDLADLLDMSHLIFSNVITSNPSYSKNILRHAIDIERVKIIDIRNLLESLDEFQAVQAMDQMASSIRIES
ncbi:nuclear factor NF-kappa-B family member relish isoform X2 [Rhynchophorus ferrugineus]|uniref:nuclear factor NF-kappa-B family member relish isoform X2 n=1 Tax=Rhynchophorus ferrugineus TaxID=354439 RepID=UPI003FCD0618